MFSALTSIARCSACARAASGASASADAAPQHSGRQRVGPHVAAQIHADRPRLRPLHPVDEHHVRRLRQDDLLQVGRPVFGRPMCRVSTGRASAGAPPASRERGVAAAQTPGWAWVPTSGRILQQRAHFSPSASRGTTATPGTSSSRKAPAGAGAPVRRQVRGDADVGEIDARQDRAQSRGRRHARPAPPRGWRRCACSRRSTSSAPVTTRRARRITSHRAASAGSMPGRGRLGEVDQMHRGLRRQGTARARPPPW